jgi:hypothetical protein
MSGQLGQMQQSGIQTSQMLCLIRQQLTELQNQVKQTGKLATAADKQATALANQLDLQRSVTREEKVGARLIVNGFSVFYTPTTIKIGAVFENSGNKNAIAKSACVEIVFIQPITWFPKKCHALRIHPSLVTPRLTGQINTAAIDHLPRGFRMDKDKFYVRLWVTYIDGLTGATPKDYFCKSVNANIVFQSPPYAQYPPDCTI